MSIATAAPLSSPATGDGSQPRPTGCIMLADGQVFYGRGFGAPGVAVAELCFNTAMTGYQEIMTDPSYAGQVVTFTFPHVGNVGVNPDDDETADPVAAGMVVKWDPTEPSNWRSAGRLADWLARRGRIGVGGVDTRRLTRAIRQQGAPHVAVAHDPDGRVRPGGSRWPAPGPSRGSSAWIWPARSPARRAIAGTRCAGPGPRATRGARVRGAGWWRSTMAPSATSCAASPRRAATSPCCRPPRRPRTSSPTRPKACSSRTAPAIRRPPAPTRCR